jgi:hypothetical protein
MAYGSGNTRTQCGWVRCAKGAREAGEAWRSSGRRRARRAAQVQAPIRLPQHHVGARTPSLSQSRQTHPQTRPKLSNLQTFCIPGKGSNLPFFRSESDFIGDNSNLPAHIQKSYLIIQAWACLCEGAVGLPSFQLIRRSGRRRRQCENVYQVSMQRPDHI